MGWSRKNDIARIYRERGGSHIVVFPDQVNGRGMIDCIGNAYAAPGPSLASTSVDPGYLRRCKRVQWSDLPQDFKNAFKHWLIDPPESIRGFWKIGCQPT